MTKVKETTKKAKILTKAEKVERAEKFAQSAYNQNVNVVNRETKQFAKTIKGARAQLLNGKVESANSLPAKYVNVLKASKKDSKSGAVIWKHMQANVRFYKNKSGEITGTGMHALLQYLYKYEADLLDMMKIK